MLYQHLISYSCTSLSFESIKPAGELGEGSVGPGSELVSGKLFSQSSPEGGAVCVSKPDEPGLLRHKKLIAV